MIANGATRGADNSASVKLDYAAAWYSWMIPPSTSRRPTSLSDRRAEVTSLAGAGTWPPWRETAARTATAGSRAETVPAKGAPDRARRDANAEASKLALDADTAPAPVLSGDPDDELDELIVNGRPTRATRGSPAPPFAPRELSVPAIEVLVPYRHLSNADQQIQG